MENWNNIEIKKAILPEDLNVLKNLNEACFPNSEDQLFEGDWSLCQNFVLWVNKKAVGYVSLQHHKGLYSYENDIYENKPDSLQLTIIGVVPSWGRLGFGRLLMNFVIFYAKFEGFRSINGITRESNKPMQYLFKKFDFKITKKIDRFYPNGETTFIEEYFFKK